MIPKKTPPLRRGGFGVREPAIFLEYSHPGFKGHSSGNQSRFTQCSPEEFARLQALNTRYHDKFGFPFILAVRGYDRHGIIDVFAKRLENDHATELRASLEQIHRIAGFRLHDLISG